MTNVVLLTVDCLRADHLGCHGYRRDTSPFLDGLARSGLWCRQAYANGPNTRHSIPSMLTSTYPLLFMQEAQKGRLHPGRTPLARVLQEHGYATAGVHSNPYISKFYGYHRGFDHFNDYMGGQVDEERERSRLGGMLHEAAKGVKALLGRRLPHEEAPTVNDAALDWIAGASQPFFCWLHYMDVHMPYVPPNRWLRELELPRYSHPRKIWMGKKIDDPGMRDDIPDSEVPDYVNLYDACIRYTDEAIRDLVAQVEERWPDTLFVITADHGEEFREHGGLSHLEKLYDELLHVPLLLYGSGVDAATLDTPVSLLDVAPSILDLLNIEVPGHMQGTPVTAGGDRGHVISEAWRDGRATAVRDGDWKLILADDTRELYNQKEDPDEQHDVAGGHPDVVGDLEREIDGHIEMLREERRRRNTRLQKAKIKKVTKGLNL